MAVSPDQIGAISRASVDMYRAAESALVALVARYLGAGIDGPMWAVQRLAAVSALRRAAQAVVDRLDRDAPGAIGQAVAAAYRAGHGSALTDLPEDAAVRLAAREAVRAVRQPAVVESLASALVADVGEQHSNVVRDTLDVYRRVIAEATAVSVAGGQTRRQAAQHAYARLIDQGITGFTDRAGRRWRLSSYVEMATRTVTQRAAVQGQTDRLQSAGIRLVIVSDTVQECRLCRPFEGKVLSLSGAAGRVQARNPVTGGTVQVQVLTTLDRARAAGFQHPNCRHSVSAYLPGVTRRPARPTADPEGDKARQRQRAIERQIRKWKEREGGALDADAAKAARKKIRAWQAEMRDHLAACHALKRLAYREQIGAGNIPPGTPKPLAPPVPRPRPTSPPPAPIPPPPPVDPAEAARRAWDERTGRARTGQGALDAAPLRLDPRTGRLVGGDTWPGRQAAGDAVRSYQGSGFQIVNRSLRQRVSPLPERAAELVAGLDDALSRSRLDADIVVERGFRPTPAFGADWANADVTGWIWTDLAYGSVTADSVVAEEFAGSRGIIMRILVPRGVGAVRVSDLGSENGGSEAEAEILLERGCRYRVVRDHGVVDGWRRVDVEVLRD
ncbi:phage minor capsid protein [Micromonospora sp. HUAS LYJ1]|uniref:phage minor capsid protein n=1 Tax=Micromonospora sp. HUAS LYJ1 TaxID=3061626 RepID=UPI0026711E81|nr:phage minor capsid protein [Micromonospora sp. HUAS LYJ1]WKU08002.1 ADP-ribosyltransferase [Micromonospora sp. HUAS LYJ1]